MFTRRAWLKCPACNNEWKSILKGGKRWKTKKGLLTSYMQCSNCETWLMPDKKSRKIINWCTLLLFLWIAMMALILPVISSTNINILIIALFLVLIPFVGIGYAVLTKHWVVK